MRIIKLTAIMVAIYLNSKDVACNIVPDCPDDQS